jgi:transcriptional regulator with XRE-family HTH domain
MLVMDGEFGQRMLLALDMANLSQADLARAIGSSKSTINKWCHDESHESTAQAADLYAASVALRVDFVWLATGTGEPRPYQRMTTASLEAEMLARDIEALPDDQRAVVAGLVRSLK